MAATTATAPAAETVEAVVSVEAVEAAANPVDAMLANIAATQAQLTTILASAKDAQAAIRVLQRDLGKVAKQLARGGGGRKRAPVAPGTGFAKPVPLSEALCAFLGVPAGTEMARTDVTKRINAYVKERGLQSPENKRVILLDDTLRTVVRADAGDVTYFNLQKFIKHNFVSAAAPAASGAV